MALTGQTLDQHWGGGAGFEYHDQANTVFIATSPPLSVCSRAPRSLHNWHKSLGLSNTRQQKRSWSHQQLAFRPILNIIMSIVHARCTNVLNLVTRLPWEELSFAWEIRTPSLPLLLFIIIMRYWSK
jgi:hypothetical protein